MKKVSIIMVNYNGLRFIGKPDIDQIVRSFLTTNYSNIEFVFVDNSSDDDSIELVKNIFEEYGTIKTKIKRNSKNLGFAGGCIEEIKYSEGEYICLVNNDDKALDKNWLTPLIQILESDNKIGAVFSKKVRWNDKKTIDAAGLTMNQAGLIVQIGNGEKDIGQYDKIRECLIWQTPVLFRRTMVDKIGGLFDEDYIILNDDTDSSLRIWLAGYKIIYVPTSVVTHKRSATMIHLPVEFVAFHGRKNTIQTLIKNYQLKNLFIWLLIILSIYSLSIFYYLSIKRVDQTKATCKAIFWNLYHIRNTLRKRCVIQNRVRKIRDENIIMHMSPFSIKKIIQGEKVWPK